MRSLLLCGVAALTIAAAAAVLLLDWPGPQQKAAEPLTPGTVEQAKVFPTEPVKKDARLVGGEEFATVKIEEETIARLPAKPIPPKPPKPVSTLPPVPVQMHRPLIERPGELRNEDLHLRFAGIVSPGLDDTCETVTESRPCGREARTALRSFIRGRTVICILPREPQGDAVEAQCTVGGKDVAGWLVGQGWAVAGDGSAYEDAMKKAREDKLGLWRDGADAKWLLQAAGKQTATGN